MWLVNWLFVPTYSVWDNFKHPFQGRIISAPNRTSLSWSCVTTTDAGVNRKKAKRITETELGAQKHDNTFGRLYCRERERERERGISET